MNGYGYGSRPRSAGSTRFRGGRGRRRDGAGPPRGREGRPPRAHQQCPPELREPFVAARDFVAGLVGAIGMPAKLTYGGVEPARDGRQVTISIEGVHESGRPRFARDRYADPEGDLGVLIGKHGATLEALTALTNAVMHHHDCEGVFFAVDVEGYRARRVSALRSLAQRGAERAAAEGVAIELSPMPPSERRIVHVTLATHPDCTTQSTGVGSNRRVVIVPRGAQPVIDDEEETADFDA